VLRARRSIDQTISTSNLWRRASSISWSSAGRRAFVPLKPWSVYSFTIWSPRWLANCRRSCSWVLFLLAREKADRFDSHPQKTALRRVNKLRGKARFSLCLESVKRKTQGKTLFPFPTAFERSICADARRSSLGASSGRCRPEHQDGVPALRAARKFLGIEGDEP